MDYKQLLSRLRGNHDCSMAIDALEAADAIEALTAELSDLQHRHEKLSDYSVERDKLVDQLIGDTRGDCHYCLHEKNWGDGPCKGCVHFAAKEFIEGDYWEPRRRFPDPTKT